MVIEEVLGVLYVVLIILQEVLSAIKKDLYVLNVILVVFKEVFGVSEVFEHLWELWE